MCFALHIAHVPPIKIQSTLVTSENDGTLILLFWKNCFCWIAQERAPLLMNQLMAAVGVSGAGGDDDNNIMMGRGCGCTEYVDSILRR